MTMQISTDIQERPTQIGQKWGAWVLFLALYYASVGSSPFSQAEVLDRSGGDIINQIVWVLFALVGVATAFYQAPKARALLRRSWPLVLVIGWLFLSSQWAPYPDLTYRRGGFLIITTIALFGLALATPEPARFLRVLVVISGFVMIINVVGVVALPGLSIGPDGAVTGLHPHKNSAGQISLVSYLIWLVAAIGSRDLRWRAAFGLGALLWFGFLILTQSKTSIGVGVLAPFALLVALNVLKTEGLVRVAVVSMLIGLAGAIWFIILGIGLTGTDLGLLAFGDLTFTGRTNLWEYLWDEIGNHPVAGFGYGSFWHTGLRSSPIDFASGWVATTGQAHNGYLDIALQTGLIGLALALVAILRSIVLAIRLASRRSVAPEESTAYITAVVLLGAILLLNFMESSYFRNNHFLSVLFILIYFLLETWSLRSEERADDGSALAG